MLILKAYIYKITNLINLKQYVGKTTRDDPFSRWREHVYMAHSGGDMVISRAIRKYGKDNFKFEVIQTIEEGEDTEDIMNQREMFWIEELDTYTYGYNSSKGGEGVGRGVRRKRGAVHPSAKAVSQYTLNEPHVHLADYGSLGEAAHAVEGDNITTIVCCIEGKTAQAYGYRWSWKGEKLAEVNYRINIRGKVYGVNRELGIKKMWESQADAAEDIVKNRKHNTPISKALERNDQEGTVKVQVKGWYLFRDRKMALSDWDVAVRDRGLDFYKRISEIGSKKLMKPVKGVHINTGEIIHFDCLSDCSEHFTGERQAGRVHGNIRTVARGGKTKGLWGYKWYYDVPSTT